MTDRAAFIRSLPKAELHVHLEGCVTPEQVVAIGRRNGVDLFGSVDAARAAYDVASLEEFLEIFAKASEVLLHLSDFAEVASAHFDQSIAEGVYHVELMFDPQAHTSRGVALGTVLAGLAAARDRARRNGLSTAIIVNFMRERDEEEALALLASLEPYQQGIVALGIDSAEIGYPPRTFVRLFEQAHAIGLKLAAHAGFEGPPEDIEEADDLLRVDRVDHGNRVYERPDLARRLGDSGVAVTVCPRAEVELGVVGSLDDHPVPAAGRKRDHQDRPFAQVPQSIGGAGRHQFCQDVAGDRLGAPATPRSGDGAHGESDSRLEGRGGEGAVEPTPFGQRRPVRQPPAHRCRRMRADGFQSPLASKAFVDVGRHAVIRIGLAALRVPEMMRNEF